MASFLVRTAVLCVFTLSCVPIQSLDYVKNWYYQKMLGAPVYQGLSDLISEGKCTSLKDKPVKRQALADRMLAENEYSVPWLIGIFNTVSRYESDFSYAKNLYLVVLNALEDIESELKQVLPTLQLSFGTSQLAEYMRDVALRGDETIYQNSVEFKNQIAKNVADSKAFLDDYKREVIKSQATNETKASLANLIDMKLAHIKKAERRLTRVERSYRNKQVELFEAYMIQKCK